MNFFKKTFGGLKASYYIRHFIFGAAISAFLIYMALQSPHGVKAENLIFFIINALLYPYARFVYEQIVSFVMGNNIFFVNALLMLMVKLFTMIMCWGFSIFIAPLGLAYIYYYHSKAGHQQ